MSKFFKFIALIFLFLQVAFPAFAINIPTPKGFVNDFADLYSSSFIIKLEENLINFEKTNGIEIAVATINTLNGGNIDDYASKLFEKWKIGKKGKDNGLLLLISKNDRKVRIEVGYGLESLITDAHAGDIIRDIIAPNFKNEEYEKGTFEAVDQIKLRMVDSYIASTYPSGSNSKAPLWQQPLLILLAFIFYLALTYFASFLGRTKEIWPGGAIGAVLGGAGGALVASISGLIIGVIIFGLIGVFLDFILTGNYNERKKRGLPTGFISTWGGLRGGGGFGGGSSGGGGASGRW